MPKKDNIKVHIRELPNVSKEFLEDMKQEIERIGEDVPKKREKGKQEDNEPVINEKKQRRRERGRGMIF